MIMFIIASSIRVNPSLEIDNDSLLPVMSLLLATWLRHLGMTTRNSARSP